MQDFASHKRVFLNISACLLGGENMLLYLVRRKILRLYRLAPSLWYDVFRCIPSLCIKVETQDFASHKRVFLNISACFNGGENLLLLLVRRKILRLYRLAPLLWYYVTDAWNNILYIIIYNICCIDFITFTVLYWCPISLASVVFKYTSLLSPSIRQSFISLARTFL